MSPSLLPNFLGSNDGTTVIKTYKLSQHRAYIEPEIIRVYEVKEEPIKKGDTNDDTIDGRKIMIGKEVRIVYIPNQVRTVPIQNENRRVSA